ncbi:MAG: hypothetical protein K5990_05090 [Oscillospiraceae bacterium]|nr:hypothetical protein [Oscillospiraceae bacterium]
MGRRKKDWLRDLGEASMKQLFAMAQTEDLKPELRLQAYKFVAEHVFGKGQAPEEPVQAGLGMSLLERRAAIARAAEQLEAAAGD